RPNQGKRSNDLVSGPVIRDLLIVLGLQAGGIGIVSFFAGFAGESPPDGINGAIGLFLGVVGFAISGSLATGNRWEHLVKVATLTTFAYIVLAQTFLHDSSGKRYLMNVLVAFLMMGLGGALSYVFKRDTKLRFPVDAPPISETQVSTKHSSGLVWVGIIGLFAVLWLIGKNQETKTPQENPNSSAASQVEKPNNAADAETQAAAFRKDFFDKYPDLIPYESVVDAVAAK